MLFVISLKITNIFPTAAVFFYDDREPDSIDESPCLQETINVAPDTRNF